jgi:hypothetical protein
MHNRSPMSTALLVKEVTKNIIDYCETSARVECLQMTDDPLGVVQNVEQINKIQERLRDAFELFEQLKRIYVSSIVSEATGASDVHTCV